MKKNIIIGILIVINMVTIGYAIQQSSESKRFKKMAEESKFQAEEAQRHAKESSQLAWQQVQKAQKEIDKQKALVEELSGSN
jgi:hypothetical protein